jgi:hypothetical protein
MTMGVSTFDREMLLPITETRVLILIKQADSPRSIHIRHLAKAGQTNPATVKLQESNDNSSYTDIAGTAQTLDAGYGTSMVISSTKPYIALSGYGNVDVEVMVVRTDTDTTLPQTVSI